MKTASRWKDKHSGLLIEHSPAIGTQSLLFIRCCRQLLVLQQREDLSVGMIIVRGMLKISSLHCLLHSIL